MSVQTTAVTTTHDRGLVEFVPFGGTDPVKLSVSIVQNLIAVPTRSGKTPTERDCLKFVAMCRAKRLNPFEGDAFLIGYDGQNGPQFSLITAHQAYLKRAEIHPEFDGLKSGIIVKEDGQLKEIEGDFYTDEQEVLGGWATVFFKGRKYPMTKRIRLSRFNKGFGQWKEDAAGMICKCAEADALRSAFPTMCGGLYTREEVEAQLVPSQPKPARGRVEVDDIPMTMPALPEQATPAEATPAQPATTPRTPARTPQAELGDLCATSGFTFDDFKTWGIAAGHLPGGEDYASYDEVPKATATRLLRNPEGIVKAMADAKGGAK